MSHKSVMTLMSRECKGHYQKLADKVGNSYDIRKNIIANIEGQTIRHINCTLLIQEGTRCGSCLAYRHSLMVKHSRQNKRIQGEHWVQSLNI